MNQVLKTLANKAINMIIFSTQTIHPVKNYKHVWNYIYL